eukprot:CAMPEP_0116842640 /NCGR_PEP_ID=MMETSP0418-20121206/11632_1 /TAXON_ID=1158023 /ORGANISM="Astrosyne radiata, Strain 13vi08-1A" /LENGTH=70 /DNA_ID=CAMNT_0004473279 /DNA_START=187 /DNA_END=399 /DNA_ORIENTATION=+
MGEDSAKEYVHSTRRDLIPLLERQQQCREMQELESQIQEKEMELALAKEGILLDGDDNDDDDDDDGDVLF